MLEWNFPIKCRFTFKLADFWCLMVIYFNTLTLNVTLTTIVRWSTDIQCIEKWCWSRSCMEPQLALTKLHYLKRWEWEHADKNTQDLWCLCSMAHPRWHCNHWHAPMFSDSLALLFRGDLNLPNQWLVQPFNW